MKRSSGPRKTASVPELHHQQLNMCALAWVVTSLLVLTQPSRAKIVYTPTHVNVDSPYNLDLNHDGVTDFTLPQNHFTSTCGTGGKGDDLEATPTYGNGVVGAVKSGADALERGVKIGPNQSFVSGTVSMALVLSGYLGARLCVYRHSISGNWVNVSNRYLGLSFQINGKTHYGWARLSVQTGYVFIHATLTGYAYEDIAGKSINAGQTRGGADVRNEEGFDTGAFFMSPIDSLQPAPSGLLSNPSLNPQFCLRRGSQCRPGRRPYCCRGLVCAFGGNRFFCFKSPQAEGAVQDTLPADQ